MKILYTIPSLESVYAARFIYDGLKNAFIDLGHEFRAYTSNDSLDTLLSNYQPDLFFYSLHFYHLKFVDLDLLHRYREAGLVVFCQIRSWENHIRRRSIGNAGSSGLRYNNRHIELIATGKAGDVFWHWFEQDEPLMDGFTEETGRRFETIHLAADRTRYFPDPDQRYSCDLAYVGAFLPSKRRFLRQNVIPLRQKYDLRIYGNDWTLSNRLLGLAEKAGQYLNVRSLRGIRSLPLSLEDERKLYSSARISLNVHEEHSRLTGCEVNERTYKVPACGGFEICDNVGVLRRLFAEDELVIADSGSDYRDKVEHFLRHPEERVSRAEAGRKRVLSEHTYHHRAEKIMELGARCKAGIYGS